MESPRFFPKSNSPSFIQLQKQIYKKEEKSLGLAITPLRLRFETYFKEKTDTSRMSSYNPSEIISKKNSQTPQISPLKTRSPTIDRVSVQEARDPEVLSPFPSRNQDKKIEDLYRSRISAATKKNDSPSRAKTEKKLFPSVFYKRNEDLVKKLDRELNTKKIVKGKGYEKSFIFND